MAPKPQFKKLAEQFVEERDEYNDEEERQYEPASGRVGLGGLGALGGHGGHGRGLGGMGGMGGRGGNVSSGFGGLGGLGGLGNIGGRGRGSLGGLQISSEKGRSGLAGFGTGKVADNTSKATGDASVHALEKISKAQEEVVKAVGQQVDAMQDICRFLSNMSTKTTEAFDIVASKMAPYEQQDSADTLEQLVKRIDDQITGDDAYLIIPGSEYQVVDFDALQDIIKDKKIHVCPGIQSVAASINREE